MFHSMVIRAKAVNVAEVNDEKIRGVLKMPFDNLKRHYDIDPIHQYQVSRKPDLLHRKAASFFEVVVSPVVAEMSEGAQIRPVRLVHRHSVNLLTVLWAADTH